MLNIYRRALREAGYPAKRFVEMVHEQGGYDAAMQLIHDSKPSSGYTSLFELGRLDLTVEALILGPDWCESTIFTDHDRCAAFNRLRQYNFRFPHGYWQPEQ